MSQIAVQKVGSLATKACLSSIPFAAFVVEILQVGVELGSEKAKSQFNIAYQRVTERFLEELSSRIEILEISAREALKADQAYEASAHAAIRALSTETNEVVAVMLGRAVGSLARRPVGAAYKTQCARVIGELNEPMLHALQTNERFCRGLLSAQERKTYAGLTERTQQMAALLSATLAMPDWYPIMQRIMDLGLLEQSSDAGIYDELPMVQTSPTSAFGRLIIDLCFEDIAVPSFGKFARA